MAGHSLRMAWTSGARRVVRLPQPYRTPLCEVEPGCTMSECDPRLAICARMTACAPCPMASIAITAATPMITPSIVNVERRGLRCNARCAMRVAISTCVMMYTPTLLPPALKTHCRWTRTRPWPCHTGAVPVLFVQADNQLLPFLQVAVLQFTELIIVDAETHHNG